MPVNPYSQLAGPQETEWTLVRATFICDECGHISSRAQYAAAEKVVTWICKNQHTNIVEDYTFDD